MMGDKVYEIINDQIKNELESYYIYLSMVVYFHSKSLDGMAHWMRCQAHEEMIHAMKFMDHIIERGRTPVLKDLKQLKTEWTSPLEAFTDAYAHEQFISGKCRDITTVVRDEHDYAAEPLMAWFNKEQVEEEANAEKVVNELEMVGDGKQGLLMIDRELGARAFVAGSPLDPVAYALVQ